MRRIPLRRAAVWLSAPAIALGLQFAAVPAAHSAAPAGDVRPAPAATAIPGKWLVVLKNGEVSKKSTTSAAHDLTKRADGTLGRVYHDALRGFSAKLSKAAATRL